MQLLLFFKATESDHHSERPWPPSSSIRIPPLEEYQDGGGGATIYINYNFKKHTV